MSTEFVEGIIINSLDHEDYAQILTIFTKRFGKLVLYAPGVRKMISKNKYSVQLYTKGNFDIFKSTKITNMSKLKTGVIIEQYHNLTKDYNTYLNVNVVCEIIEQLSETNLPDLETYALLDVFLKNQNADFNKFAGYVIALFYLLEISGAKPLFDRCVRCRKASRWYRRYDYKQSGLVCISCFRPNENIQSQSYLNIFLDVQHNTYEQMILEKYNILDLIALHIFLLNYYENVVGLKISGLREIKKTAAFKIPVANEDDYN